MYFNFSILNALVGHRGAVSLLDDELIESAHDGPDHEVTLFNKTQSASIAYSLLHESQKLSSQISQVEMRRREHAIQDETAGGGCASIDLLDGMEFTPSNRIKKMKMPDSFNILMLEIITKLRKVYVQTIK
ncbi:hypothetical protein ENBRE01_3468, partial [Enteropsectra breve]